MQTYELIIDPEEFRNQRQFLSNLLSKVTTDAELDLLEGLLNLTDEIADQAHDKYGLDVLMYVEDDAPEPLEYINLPHPMEDLNGDDIRRIK